MEKVILDFSTVEVKDLKGTPIEIKGLNQEFGNTLYLSASTIPISRIAQKLYDEDKAEVDYNELKLIYLTLFQTPKFKPFLAKPIQEYLDDLLKQLTDEDDKHKDNKPQ